MIREITVKMYYNIDEEMVKKDLLEVVSKERVEELIKDQLTNIYCDDIGFECVETSCLDYKKEDGASHKLIQWHIDEIKEKE